MRELPAIFHVLFWLGALVLAGFIFYAISKTEQDCRSRRCPPGLHAHLLRDGCFCVGEPLKLGK